MIKKNFDEVWKSLPQRLKHEIKCYLKSPTERNCCYLTGYISAMSAASLMTRNEYTYLLALFPKVRESKNVQDNLKDWTKL